MASFIFLPVIFYNTCIRKRFSDKQNYTDHDNWDNDQIITLKRGNSSNSFDFNDVYSFLQNYRIILYVGWFCMFFDAMPVDCKLNFVGCRVMPPSSGCALRLNCFHIRQDFCRCPCRSSLCRPVRLQSI